MKGPERNTSVALGALLIAGIAFGILNSVPALEKPDYLVALSAIRPQVLSATFFQFTMAVAYACLAILFYPILKPFNERIALGYLGFRLIGAMFLFVGIVSLLSLSFMSSEFVAAGQPASSHFQTLGELLRRGRDWFNHVAMILPWSIGGILLCYSLLKMGIIPKWLSIWGLIGYCLTLGATIALMLDGIVMATPLYFALNTPTALCDVVLAGYLVFKGFIPRPSEGIGQSHS